MEKYNLDKFINATLFFVKKKVKKLGITKLNKLLYYSDFEHYRLYGRPILGDNYKRMEHGPVPKRSYNIFNENFKNNTDDSLKNAIYLRLEEFSYDKETKVIVAKRKPDLSFFSKSEIDVMENVAFIWKDVMAETATYQSHLEKPWKETPKFQDIDYKLALNDSPDSVSREYLEYQEKEDLLLRESFI